MGNTRTSRCQCLSSPVGPRLNMRSAAFAARRISTGFSGENRYLQGRASWGCFLFETRICKLGKMSIRCRKQIRQSCLIDIIDTIVIYIFDGELELLETETADFCYLVFGFFLAFIQPWKRQRKYCALASIRKTSWYTDIHHMHGCFF